MKHTVKNILVNASEYLPLEQTSEHKLNKNDPVNRKIIELIDQLNKILKNKKLSAANRIRAYNQALSSYQHFEKEKQRFLENKQDSFLKKLKAAFSRDTSNIHNEIEESVSNKRVKPKIPKKFFYKFNKTDDRARKVSNKRRISRSTKKKKKKNPGSNDRTLIDRNQFRGMLEESFDKKEESLQNTDEYDDADDDDNDNNVVEKNDMSDNSEDFHDAERSLDPLASSTPEHRKNTGNTVKPLQQKQQQQHQQPKSRRKLPFPTAAIKKWELRERKPPAQK